MPPDDPPTASAAELAGPGAHAALARLRQQRPVAWIPDLSGWLITRYDLAVAVLRDPARFTVDDPRFSTAQVVGASMLSLDGADHRRHRAPFVAPFRPRQVEARFGAQVERLADELLARCHDGTAEVRTALAGPLAVAVVADALGLGEVDAACVLGWYADIVDAVSAISTGTTVAPAARAAVIALSGPLRAGLAEPGDSLLAAAASTLTADEIVANAAVMLFGGIETTEAMIANVILHVLRRPHLAAAVRADPHLAVAVVEESLRLEPAAAVVDRYATTPVTVGDQEIADGDFVRISLSAANRDPAVFPRPDDFDPGRVNLRSQLAFAVGPHVCVAMDLARLEARIALLAVLGRPAISLVAADEVQGLVFRKPARVSVRWTAP